jgi:hypothetical protein
MIKRELYLKQLRDFIDKPFIKVITGLRRSGKSSILMLLRDELWKDNIEGIQHKHIADFLLMDEY